jgi:hypothetical protein
VDPAQALTELKQISVQVGDAVIFEEGGDVVASTLDDARAAAMAKASRELLEASGGAVQIEAALGDGSVVVVREGSRAVAATTAPDPTIGLVFYDLRTCLRTLEEPEEQRKPKRKAPARRKKDDEAA